MSALTERLLKYVAFETTSNENSGTFPSSLKELELAAYLEEEMKAVGLSGVRQSEYGYVYGYIPASEGINAPAMGFIAHMDTSPSVSGANIKARIVHYEGGDLELGNGMVTDLRTFPQLADYEGQDLVITDGSTLLGADDKAGIAEILAAAEFLLAHPEIKHGKISIAFSPDEEIGTGMDHFDLDGFDAEFAYTVDGGALGELEYECFNACAVSIRVNGVNIHPGSAKNKMKNAVLMANDFISRLPAAETPAHTEGYEGYYHVSDISGNESRVDMGMIIRDHDKALFEKRKDFVTRLCEYLNTVYGGGTFELGISDTYYNMREKIEPVMFIIDRAKTAMLECGVEPRIIPIRGGTDGAALSYRGLPCPNLSTGGENFHGVNEFISVQSMEKMTEVLVKLVEAK